MALEVDQEILQDFLVEANEILEQLNEQLVELEQRPDDSELLNAVFRGFHTIKGGAGFLGLTQLVDVCHRAEDVFNLLRNREREVDSDLMDVILPVLDVLNSQFDSLRAGEEPEEAEPELLRQLDVLKQPPGAASEAPAEPAAEAPPSESVPETPAESAGAEAQPEAVPSQLLDEGAAAGGDSESGDITDEEFEALLDALEHSGEAGSAPAAAGGGASEAAPASDEITEDEFEALLDELHGKGQFQGAPAAETESKPEAADSGAAADDSGGESSGAAPAGDEITEDEFEALLDELHGKGQFKGAPDDAAESTPDTGGTEAAAGAGDGGEPPKQEPPKQEPPKQEPPKQEPPKPAASAPAPAKETKPAEQGAKKKPEGQAPQAETTVRVDTKRLDDIMNMVGELVLVRNRLATLANTEDSVHSQAREEMRKAVANLDVVTGDLQSSVMKTRMQPIKKVFGRFPRVVRDLSRSLEKEVKLEMEGEDTDLDKNLVEALADPLVHLVRNAVDHGIEQPAEREAAGKPRAGKLLLSASQEGDHILLVIDDDGGGMDADKLRKIAVEKGVLDEEAAARLEDKEAYNLIFAPGFSTKSEISDISGRGVGMDVVKNRIAQLNGSIEIDSELGRGTRLAIKVPLTLAIMPTLMIRLQEQTFALPLASVSEIFNLDLTHTNVVDGQLVVMVRDKPLPLYYLTRWLVHGARGADLPKAGYVVVVHVGTQLVGFVVDHLIGQEEVVIKPLGNMLHGTPGMAGATITGDGKIALILDVPGLMRAYGRRG